MSNLKGFSFPPRSCVYRNGWCTCGVWPHRSWGDSGTHACGGTFGFGCGEFGLFSACGGSDEGWGCLYSGPGFPGLGDGGWDGGGHRECCHQLHAECPHGCSDQASSEHSIKTMMDTMEKLKLGTTGSGVEAPSKPEDVTSAAAASRLDSPLSMRVRWNWPAQVEGVWEGHWSQTYVLAEVPFAMEGVTKGAPIGRSGSNPNARVDLEPSQAGWSIRMMQSVHLDWTQTFLRAFIRCLPWFASIHCRCSVTPGSAITMSCCRHVQWNSMMRTTPLGKLGVKQVAWKNVRNAASASEEPITREIPKRFCSLPLGVDRGKATQNCQISVELSTALSMKVGGKETHIFCLDARTRCHSPVQLSWTSRYQWHASESLIPMIVARYGQMIWASILILAVFGRVVTAYVAMNSQKALPRSSLHVAGPEGLLLVASLGPLYWKLWRHHGPRIAADGQGIVQLTMEWDIQYDMSPQKHAKIKRQSSTSIVFDVLIGIYPRVTTSTLLLWERFSLAFTRLPQQTVFWNQNFGTPQQEVKGGWLLLVCHFLDALQTLDNINYR